MQILDLINKGSLKLKKNNILSHKLDSEILLSKILSKSREQVLLNLNQKIEQNKINRYLKFLDRRSSNEPIAYILKEKEFWSKSFFINNDTLIPRPETELMVEKIVNLFKNKRIFMLDVGTGSGCIVISILSELKKSKGIGLDISQKALRVAAKNCKIFGLKKRIKLYKKFLHEINHVKFDLIVSNPPYIKRKDLKNLKCDIKRYEPKLALDGGNDGLDVIKKVIYKSKSILKINGMLALEIGNGQLKKVSKILKDNRFKIKYLIKDYQENVRCILAILNNN